MSIVKQKYWQFLISDEGVPIPYIKVKVFNSSTLGIPTISTTIPIYDSIESSVPVPLSEVTTNENGYFEFWVRSDTDSIDGISDPEFDVTFDQKARIEWWEGGVTQGSLDDLFVGIYNVGIGGSAGTYDTTGNVYVPNTTPASVRNISDSTQYINFEFTLPQGFQGFQGHRGHQGPTGPIGNTGTKGLSGSNLGLSCYNVSLRLEHTIDTTTVNIYESTNGVTGTMFHYLGPTCKAIIAVTAGGGGGAGGGRYGGAGGGGGGTMLFHMELVNNTYYYYRLGAGGAGGAINSGFNTSNNGGNGLSSQFHTLENTNVGVGGQGYTAPITFLGIRLYGGAGGNGAGLSNDTAISYDSTNGQFIGYNEGVLPHVLYNGGTRNSTLKVGSWAAGSGGGGASLYAVGGNAGVSLNVAGSNGLHGSGGGGGSGANGRGGNGGRGCINIYY